MGPFKWDTHSSVLSMLDNFFNTFYLSVLSFWFSCLIIGLYELYHTLICFSVSYFPYLCLFFLLLFLNLLWLISSNLPFQLYYLLIYQYYLLFRASGAAHRSSQARDPGLHHSHSNAGSKPPLQPTPQLMAMPDPQPTEGGQESNLHPYRL